VTRITVSLDFCTMMGHFQPSDAVADGFPSNSASVGTFCRLKPHLDPSDTGPNAFREASDVCAGNSSFEELDLG
jgi:hypothetical protein